MSLKAITSLELIKKTNKAIKQIAYKNAFENKNVKER